MSKTERLFAVMDALRRHRTPVTAAQLAKEQGVSVRTVYRDVQTLLRLGAPIEGEAGIGYLLRPGFFLPPLTFTAEELEALVLGARWVQAQADDELAQAARNALGKIAAAARDDLRDRIDDNGLWPVLIRDHCAPVPVLRLIRRAMRDELALAVCYEDETGRTSERHIWPVRLAYYEGKQIVAAWCCLRESFRHFRVDRVTKATLSESRYGRPRKNGAPSGIASTRSGPRIGRQAPDTGCQQRRLESPRRPGRLGHTLVGSHSMNLSQMILPEFDQEMANTRKVLARVPGDKLGWKAHEKSNTIGWVATHLADIPAWVEKTFTADSLDIAPPGAEPYRTPTLESVPAILEYFDKNVAAARAVIAAARDEDFSKPWSLLSGGQVVFTMPRLVVLRSFVLNHSIHHRAHLCVYLRLNDVPVPGLYGPSADEAGT